MFIGVGLVLAWVGFTWFTPPPPPAPPTSKKMPNECPPFNLVRERGRTGGGGGGGVGGLMKPFFFLPKIPTKQKLPNLSVHEDYRILTNF